MRHLRISGQGQASFFSGAMRIKNNGQSLEIPHYLLLMRSQREKNHVWFLPNSFWKPSSKTHQTCYDGLPLSGMLWNITFVKWNIWSISVVMDWTHVVQAEIHFPGFVQYTSSVHLCWLIRHRARLQKAIKLFHKIHKKYIKLSGCNWQVFPELVCAPPRPNISYHCKQCFQSTTGFCYIDCFWIPTKSKRLDIWQIAVSSQYSPL